MSAATRRSFGAWFVDVLSGLLAFTIAWAVKHGVGAEFRDEFPRAIITFVAVYVALKLGWRLFVVQRDHARQTAIAQKAVADATRKAMPPPPPPLPPSSPPSTSTYRSPGP